VTVQTLPWRRNDAIEAIRDRIWLYLSPASAATSAALDAALLLELGDDDATTVGQALYLLSDEVGAVIDASPSLLRRLPTTSVVAEERSTERVRGAVRWQPTILERRRTGATNLVITSPSERAFDSPEALLLATVLTGIVDSGRSLGWDTGTGHAGAVARERATTAARLVSTRVLAPLDPRPPTTRQLMRISTGRHRRRFDAVVAAHLLHHDLVTRRNEVALRSAIQCGGLVVQAEDRLFELWCLFRVLDELAALGWSLPRPRVFAGGLALVAIRSGDRLEVRFQRLPQALRKQSVYRTTLAAHGLSASNLQPDLTLTHLPADGPASILLLESKMGQSRPAAASAREAVQNLLAYGASFKDAISKQPAPYGLGLVWGSGLRAVEERIMLCSIDRVGDALASWFAALRSSSPA
jgi:hypothetical protein